MQLTEMICGNAWNLQTAIEEREKEVFKRKDETFRPKFWSYLNECFEMVASIRSEAGMVLGDNGKPVRCYANNSESMNNVMRSAKETYLNGNPCVSQLNKFQFTKNVFEVVHAHQMEEPLSAIAWLSDNYILADYASYLKVPADIWFEWTPKMRETYVLGVQKLSLQDVYKQKDVPWPVLEPTDIDSAEFRPLQDDIVTELVDNHGYCNYLLNHPTAIQSKASPQTEGVLQFEVASTGAKNGTVQVSVYRDHATCVCGRYKYDKVCKHSLAVASFKAIMTDHLNFIRKKSSKVSKRTALAEHDVQKATAGKKRRKEQIWLSTCKGQGTAKLEQIYGNSYHFGAVILRDTP